MSLILPLHGIVSQGSAPPATCDKVGIVAVGSPDNRSNSAQVGYRFTVDSAAAPSGIEVCSLRAYPNGGPYNLTVRIWDSTTEALVTSAQITGAAALTWNEVAITPVTLTAGKDYIVSVRPTDGSSWNWYRDANAGAGTFGAGVIYVQGRYSFNNVFPFANSPNINFGLADIKYKIL